MSTSVFLFYTLASLTAVCAIAMVVSQNIVRAAAWLLFTLAGVSGIFFLLGAEFVGATQLLVYVGGTLVLVVFGVMLTAQGPFISMKSTAGEWAASLTVGLLLFGVLVVALMHPKSKTKYAKIPEDRDQRNNSLMLGMALVNMKQVSSKDDVVTGTPAYKKYAESGQKNTELRPRRQMAYLLPFEIVSVHLLVVLIGAAYLARTKRARKKVQAAQEGEATS